MKVQKALFITFISFILVFSVFVKILGSTDITIDVEKDGYCKQYGDEWRNKIYTNECYNPYHFEGERHIFTEEEFKITCPQNELFSLNFYSDCFYKSNGIS